MIVNIALTVLMSVWVFLLVALVVTTVITMLMPKIFQLREDLDHAERKQVNRTITVETVADYKHNLFFRVSVYGGALAILVMFLAALAMLLNHYVLGLGLVALTAGLYLFLGVVIPSYQYTYWSKHKSPDFTLLAQEKFSELIILRSIRTILLILLFLMPTILSSQFLLILVKLISKVMGY